MKCSNLNGKFLKFSCILLLAVSSNIAACSSVSVPTPSETLMALNDKYAPEYNPEALPILPPSYSVSAGIWVKDGIPATPVTTTVQFISHDAPDYIQLSEESMRGVDCEPYSSNPMALKCETGSPLLEFDCDRLDKPYNLVVGLNPAYPLIAECEIDPLKERNGNYLYRAGCIVAWKVGYVFEIKGNYTLVKTLSEMQAIFAPIESPKEALSYAIAVTGLEPMFNFDDVDFQNTVFYQNKIEGTHVAKIENGYSIHLFQRQSCGCDTYITSEIDITVDFNGEIFWDKAMPIYIRFEPGLCVD